MKKYFSLIIIILFAATTFACPVCERNKANAILALTHGSKPNSQWDYIIVYVAIIIAIFTLYYSIKWLIKPNETDKNHIKLFILND